MQDRLIDREEVAKMAGISLSKLHNAIRVLALGTPRYVAKEGQKHMYSLIEWEEYLKHTNLKNIEIDICEVMSAEDQARQIDLTLALQFITGRKYTDIKKTKWFAGKRKSVEFYEPRQTASGNLNRKVKNV
jgi:hypothetical protein